MKIVLTGGSSFSGLWYARALASAGHEVVMPLRATSIGEYVGIRASRVRELEKYGRVIWGIDFGSENFFAWLQNESLPDIFCCHAASVTGHKSRAFDVERAFAQNTRRFPELVTLLKNIGCKGIVFTGTYYEPDEGIGPMPREAFSPYALSKSLSYTAARYYCQTAHLPIGKFVMPNPFGPFEEKGFTFALLQSWLSREIMQVRTPDYLRDNIHVDLLALAFEAFCRRVATGSEPFARTAPSGYAETQGAFAQRFQAELRARTDLSCDLELCRQTDFSEPPSRHNEEPTAHQFPGWDEVAAWDRIACVVRLSQRDGGRPNLIS